MRVCALFANPRAWPVGGSAAGMGRAKPPWLRDGRASGLIAAFPPALSEREEVVLNVLLAASWTASAAKRERFSFFSNELFILSLPPASAPRLSCGI